MGCILEVVAVPGVSDGVPEPFGDLLSGEVQEVRERFAEVFLGTARLVLSEDMVKNTFIHIEAIEATARESEENHGPLTMPAALLQERLQAQREIMESTAGSSEIASLFSKSGAGNKNLPFSDKSEGTASILIPVRPPCG